MQNVLQSPCPWLHSYKKISKIKTRTKGKESRGTVPGTQEGKLRKMSKEESLGHSAARVWNEEQNHRGGWGS